MDYFNTVNSKSSLRKYGAKGQNKGKLIPTQDEINGVVKMQSQEVECRLQKVVNNNNDIVRYIKDTRLCLLTSACILNAQEELLHEWDISGIVVLYHVVQDP